MLLFKGHLPVTIDLTKKYVEYRPVDVLGSARYAQIKIPTFSYTGFAWYGASFIAVEFHVELDHNVSLLGYPFTPPAGCNFCLAVRKGTGSSLKRYRLWGNVAELLSYPIYNGQNLSDDFYFEVWTTSAHNIVSLASPLYFTTTEMIFETTCSCERTSQITEADENPWLFQPLAEYVATDFDWDFTLARLT